MIASKRDKAARVPLLNLGTANSIDKVGQITEFLKDNYLIETNRFDPSKKRIKSLKRRYQFPPNLDDISLHMMEEGVPFSETILQKLLRSPNRTKTYDPLAEYFHSLRGLEITESHIDYLISHLNVREFDDRPQGYYKERAGRLIRKWLVSAVACALGDYANEAALVFVGEQEGRGKTWLAEWLCPDILKDMYIVSKSDKRKFSIEDAITENFLILYDDQDGLSPSMAEEFKKAVSARSLAVKRRWDISPVMRQRIGSVLVTSNNRSGTRHGFLHPSLGTRRFICIHIDSINFEYRQVCETDAVWAEALKLYEDPDYDHRLTQEDFAEFEDVNQRYMMETPAGAIVQQAFTVPVGDEQEGDAWMNATEVVAVLQRQKLIKAENIKYLTPQHIGEALRSLGFPREMKYDNGRRLYKYYVRML